MKKFEKALIIDDDVDLTMLLRTILKASIGSVDCAYNLEQGREMAGKVNPDVIFLDNNLPDGLGINNIADLKAIASNAAVVMITAMGNSAEKALQNGADIFLEKPLTSANIEEVLRKVSSRSDSQV